MTARSVEGRTVASETPNAAKAPPWLAPELAKLFLEMLERLPLFPSRRDLANQISGRLYRVSHRSIEGWPVVVRHINGVACPDRQEALEYAFRKVVESGAIRGGRRGVTRNPDPTEADHQVAA